MSDCRIKFVQHQHAWQLYQARRDFANVMNQPLVEHSHWFEDTQTGRLYYDLFACLGWPSEVKENSLGLPGYAAIVGIIRPNAELDQPDPTNAKFLVLEETEHIDVPTLLSRCDDMRKRWGFGIHPDLLRVWYGDPERFLTVLARRNEWLARTQGEGAAIMVSPPEDFYFPKSFDLYSRCIQSVLVKRKDDAKPRLFFGGNEILKNKLREFSRDDPAILAAGGLVHTLLSQTLWMDNNNSTIFTVNEQ